MATRLSVRLVWHDRVWDDQAYSNVGRGIASDITVSVILIVSWFCGSPGRVSR